MCPAYKIVPDMAEGTRHGGHHQAGMFDQESSAHPHLEGGCPSDELALYEGLEQLGMRAEQSQSQGLSSGESRRHTNPAGAGERRTLSNTLIDVKHESSTSDHRPQPPQPSEERDDFGLPPQRPTSSRASRPTRDVLITELDMYEAGPLSQNPWAGEQDGQDHTESSRYIEQDNRAVNIQVGPDGPQTELDAYEAMRSPVHEPLRGDAAGTVMQSHDPSNPGEGASAEAATIQPSTRNQPECEEQSPPRRNNSIVLPRWQPDAEVTYCPICSTQFSWFNRKHHCRKCGRVVCATCSQHRITIPHEFIVHPPQDTSPADRRPSLSQRDTEVASTTCGGTKVRLCNPCVPDPNTLPPPPIRSPDRERQPDRPTYLMSGFGDGQFRITEEALNAFEAMGNEQSAPVDRRRRATSYYTPPAAVHRAPFAESRFPQRTSSQHTRNTSYTGPHYAPPPQSSPGAQSQSYGAPPPYMSSNTSRPPPQPRQAHYSTGLLNPFIAPHPGQQHVQSMLDPSAPPAPAPTSAQVPRRREVIPEEDTCWVCLADLRTVAEAERRRRIENGTAESWSDEEAQKVREAHVNDCIIEGERIRQGRNRRQQSTSQTSTQPSEGTAGPSSTPVRAPRRYYELFPFIATEKDCIDDAECSMCLEDFEPGAKMARLECFCRFHEDCIRTWWERKPGMCPVHGRDMEGL